MAITLTERAAAHITDSLARRGKGVGLRLGVKAVGCSGLAYKVDYVDTVESSDLKFESHGVTLFVDPKSLPALDGMEVDYAREGLSTAFRFNNPNVKASCGCGESFSV